MIGRTLYQRIELTYPIFGNSSLISVVLISDFYLNGICLTVVGSWVWCCVRTERGTFIGDQRYLFTGNAHRLKEGRRRCFWFLTYLQSRLAFFSLYESIFLFYFCQIEYLNTYITFMLGHAGFPKHWWWDVVSCLIVHIVPLMAMLLLRFRLMLGMNSFFELIYVTLTGWV